ncbi:MAG: helix-turn-helix domain-containing protein [Deltaproteobacteria bacterium]|nr:helix-turn-helix domain-containing protein [Deltaproteobacteria bacterium]
MKIEEHKKAIELRHQGLTYPEIGKILGVGRGTLSHWLKTVPHTPSQESLSRRMAASIRNGMKLRERKIVRVTLIKENAKQEIEASRFTNEVLKLLGIMAYWCEGSKTQDSAVKFTNSEASLIKFMMRWLRIVCEVPESKFRIHIRVHPNVNHDDAKIYWSNVTGVPISQFFKVTVKVSESGGKRPNQLPYGIVTINVCDTNLMYRIRGWIEALGLGTNGINGA